MMLVTLKFSKAVVIENDYFVDLSIAQDAIDRLGSLLEQLEDVGGSVSDVNVEVSDSQLIFNTLVFKETFEDGLALKYPAVLLKKTMTSFLFPFVNWTTLFL